MKSRPQQKQFRFEVDQSVRIEELNRDTVIGAANKDKSIAMILPRKVKRHFNEDFRRLGKPRQFAPLLFAGGIVILFQKCSIRPSALVIDTEYASHEGLIIQFLEVFYPLAIVSISHVGKNSPGHAAAYLTHVGKRKANGTITQSDVHGILRQLKTAGERHHLEFTRIHQSNRPVIKKHSKKT